MEFIDEKLLAYSGDHTEAEPLVLQELNRETQAKILNPRMLSGHLQGRCLSMLSYMIKPQYILEIGTYTGYSAICLAEGLKPHGKLTTIDINDELSEIVYRYIEKAGFAKRIEHITGNALEILPGIHTNFDLVFIDADKENYSKYFDLVFDKVNVGGYIIADNVLWSGHVIEDPSGWDLDTKGIHEFNEKIKKDSRVSKVLLPIRDGLLIIRKLH